MAWSEVEAVEDMEVPKPHLWEDEEVATALILIKQLIASKLLSSECRTGRVSKRNRTRGSVDVIKLEFMEHAAQGEVKEVNREAGSGARSHRRQAWPSVV